MKSPCSSTLLLCLLLACSSNERSIEGAAGVGGTGGASAQGANGSPASPGASGNGDAGRAPSGGTGGSSPGPAGGPPGQPPLSPDGGASEPLDAGVALIAPVPVEPCDERLDAQKGQVAPDFGDPEGAQPLAGDPDDMGSFAVWQQDATIPNPDSARAALDATFYAPSSDGGGGVSEGVHPLVLVMHGFGTTHRNYAHFTGHLASHGFVVLGLTLPFALVAAHDKNADEAIAAIDYALSDEVPAELAGHVDSERIAVAGHSFGGKIAFFAASQDPRIDLVIGWDPSNAGGPPCFVDPNACNGFPVAPNCLAEDSGLVHQLQAESLVFRAAPDGANPEPAHNAIHFYRGAPAPATLLDFDSRVLHGDFANPAAAVIPHTRRVHLSWLRARFLALTTIEPYGPGGARVDEDMRVVRVLSRP